MREPKVLSTGTAATDATAGRIDGDEGSAQGDGVGAPALRALARAMLDERAALDRFLDSDLFADPALDILLFLFAEGGRDATTTAACTAARVPRTTALRWIKLLADRGLLVMGDDAEDRRMTLLRLSPAGRNGVAAWLVEASRQRDACAISGQGELMVNEVAGE